MREINFPNEEQEREFLIGVLMERYPYPRNVWSRKTTSQLWAIYYRPVPETFPVLSKEDEAELRKFPLPDMEHDEPIRYNDSLNGIEYILADNGEYVRYQP